MTLTSQKSKIKNQKSKILVVGGSVAGASAAIRFAQSGFKVTVVERERFPRHKLCGEFISPECLAHFRALGVLPEMLTSGGDSISETVFYAPNGKSVSVASQWFGGAALGLSRAQMDFQLLERARLLGAEILEETQAVGLLTENGKARGVKFKNKNGQTQEIEADFTIDATGRARILAKLAEKEFKNQKSKIKNQKSKLVGFKAHLRGARAVRGRCEIYFFRGGYGGLNFVENDLSNHCFLVEAPVVREFGNDAERIVREVIFRNKRAEKTLFGAETADDWLAVSVDEFGRKNLAPAPRLLAIGDAGAFIDPFTGSGMLMALESSELAFRAISENQDKPQIAEIYQKLHRQKFNRRLRVCSLLRRAAFMPDLAATLIHALSFSQLPVSLLARATRPKYDARI